MPADPITVHPRRLQRVRDAVLQETTGGMLLLAAAALALLWANSPFREAYARLRDLTFGPEALHLHLSLATWAADGLLAVFFFVVGVELKHELVAGSLRRPREAAVPMLAAVGGMVAPALIYTALVRVRDPGALGGWAIPTATDIAFALAVLAVFGRGLPRALRLFLLTLAVVDDLLAILVIAAFFSETLHPWPLLGSMACIALFAILVRARRLRRVLLVIVAVAAWAFMHACGVHATVAGVLLGASVPAVALHGERQARTHTLDDAVRPFSAGFALPVFAFFAAGVTLVGRDASVLDQPVFTAVIAGLVLGKLVGVLGTTALVTRLTPLRLPDAIGLIDLLPIGMLCGIGFTVSLLISELSFEGDPRFVAAKSGVLVGSLIAGTLGAVALRWDAGKARSRDMNRDGRPDEDTTPIGAPVDAPREG